MYYFAASARFCRLCALILTAFVLSTCVLRAQDVVLESPNSRVRSRVTHDDAGILTYTVEFDGRTVIAPSRIGLELDGIDLGATVAFGPPTFGAINETYPQRGVKAIAVNRARTLRLPLVHRLSGQAFTLEARAYDDGFAWRLLVPGQGLRRVQGEASTWTLPAHCRVWFAERNSNWKLKTYAGEWISADVEALPTISNQGPIQPPPLVVELPGRAGYAVVTEAALAKYSGLRLRATGHRRLQADFTEGNAGFTVEGDITTPWRVTLLNRDLNELVNNAVISHLASPPDPVLYADTSYIKPGRSVWRWWSVGTGTPVEERRFIDYAAELGFEYSMIDEGWASWPDAWHEIKTLAEYGQQRGVGIVIWSDVKDLRDPSNAWQQLRLFLDLARDAGVAAVKLDFINSEARDSVDFELAALRLAAERRLMVNFHGIQKPTGEPRTYPNEITREGIRGLELNKILTEGVIPASHNAALPFTRLVVGHGDYTPLGYSRPGATTWAHQLATVVQFTSPMQVIGEHPQKLLHDPATQPALDVIKAIPAVWDETRVLEPSRIGELSIIARRSGSTWFLSILTGNRPVKLPNITLSFLDDRPYRMIRISSPQPHRFSREESTDIGSADTLAVDLAAGDGLVSWFQPLRSSNW